MWLLTSEMRLLKSVFKQLKTMPDRTYQLVQSSSITSIFQNKPLLSRVDMFDSHLPNTSSFPFWLEVLGTGGRAYIGWASTARPGTFSDLIFGKNLKPSLI